VIRLVALYGVGDAYLICGLVRAFEKEHSIKACVVVKSAQVAIPQMFGVDYEASDEVVASAEGSQFFQLSHANEIADRGFYYVHPHFVRTPVRIDQLTVKPRVSQADMYRALLGLSPWAPLEVPFGPRRIVRGSGTLIIHTSRSWPNLPPQFWEALAKRMDARLVEPEWSLRELFDQCDASEHVIGPQCGVMSVLCDALFFCRKTFAICELSKANPYLFGLTETMPYGHCSTFAGNDHPDVRHFVVSPTNWEEAVERIAVGI